MAYQGPNNLEPWRELNDKVVMVTGASSGLGREFCLDLAKAGCRVVALARRVDRLKTLCEEINNKAAAGSGVRAVAVELDVRNNGATIERSVEKAWEAFGRIDALVNNAGIRGTVKRPLDLAEEEWNDVIRTNLTGSWLVSKFVCIRMRAANLEGSVINISSTEGLNRGYSPGGVAYASSKAGLNTMTKMMALELGVHKIRVNSISPGIFKSEITESLMQKPWLNNVALKIIPLKEFGTTDPALTTLIRYLVHDSSKYVTGNIFVVEAGITLSGQVSYHLEPWRDLNEKVVMVTGASSGLGREFCLDLANTGCRVVALARRVDRLKTLCDEIKNKPAGSVRAKAVELDVCADATTIERSVQKAWEAFGRIDALVNNAGVRGSVKNPLDWSEKEWNDVIKTNLTGSWLVSKFVCMRMRDAMLEGSIINISSIAGLNRGHLPGGVAYASSKAGLNTMTKVMALELGVHKIRVNSISPGLFKSEITESLMQKPWITNVASKTVPLRDYGTSNPALTSLVRYLVHDSSKYVTGNIFTVDAGVTLPGVPIFSSL